MTFSSVLIANRGEIAERIIDACHGQGLRTIAVYSDADAGARFTRLADDAVRIGPTAPAQSYLSIEAIIEAARATGAEAVHPGYGFLSERAEFARAVVDAGLVFIGPPADVIELMGRKDLARTRAQQAGVPVTPQYDPAAVPADAYPVIVKAASGGGGKGMHIVSTPDDLTEALARAEREALAAFGDATVLIEKYVTGGHHVEVQILADSHGTVLALGDRDCSAQRRHQKVIEEAPAPNLPDGIRRILHESSVSLAREVSYVNAGTVEFLVDDHGAYFLEMNTRLQVEHRVTEQVTGLDLVALQLDIAAGRPLGFDRAPAPQGHSLEMRVYAEDPAAGFLPAAGRVVSAQWPADALVDGGPESGDIIGTAYDPMIAKITVHGADRDDAIARAKAALESTVVAGVRTNIGFMRDLLASDAFVAGLVDTGWLDAHGAEIAVVPEPTDDVLEAAAMAFLDSAGATTMDGWRLGGPAHPTLVRLIDTAGKEHTIHVRKPEQRQAEQRQPLQRQTVRSGNRVFVSSGAHLYEFSRPDPMRRAQVAGGGGPQVTSPMPGTVLAVVVAVGDDVVEGQTLAVIEAMKMELAMKAPADGTVTSVDVAVGDQVAIGSPIAVVEARDD